MSRILSILVLTLVSLFAGAGVSLAEESLTANAAITSDYVFRGETRSDDSPAIQGGIDYIHDLGFYAGAWASTVDETSKNNSSNNGGGGLEIDGYAGWAHNWDNFGVDIGYIIYDYTDSKFSAGERELYLGANWGPADLTYYIGNDQSAANNNYIYIDAGVTFELQEDVGISFHYGYKDRDVGSSITDLKVEVTKTILDFDVGLAATYENGTDNITTSKDTELFLTVRKAFQL